MFTEFYVQKENVCLCGQNLFELFYNNNDINCYGTQMYHFDTKDTEMSYYLSPSKGTSKCLEHYLHFYYFKSMKIT